MTAFANLSTPFLEGLLANYDGNIDLDSKMMDGSNSIQAPMGDLLAREVYARVITLHGGTLVNGNRLTVFPSKKSGWEAVVRYVGTLFPLQEKLTQERVVKQITETVGDAQTVSEFMKPDYLSILRNLVDMNILERIQRPDGSTEYMRTKDRGHPMAIGKGVIPRF